MSERVAVVCLPKLTPTDRGWVDSVRSRHLAREQLSVEPHVTLVFPCDEVDRPEIRSHLAVVAAESGPFDVALRAAVLLPDPFTGEFVVALVPDEGNSRLLRLHDRLYTGPFTQHQPVGVPFVPHLTLARMTASAAARALADDVNGGEPDLRTRVTDLVLMRLQAGRIEAVATQALRG